MKRAREESTDDDAATRARKMAAMLSQGIGIAAPAVTSSNAPPPPQSSAPMGGGGGGGGTVVEKIRVPTELNPGFNYMGLLLGPKGSTLKRMEAESGARLKIRGREALRPGQQPNGPEDEEPLHVTIMGGRKEVDEASRLVNELLFDDKKAMEIKQRQLEEVARAKGGGAGGMPPMGGGGMGGGPPTLGGGGGGAPGSLGSFTEDGSTIVMIPSHFAGIIIGRGGENIRAIQIDTTARIQVQQTEEVQPGQERRITISGSDDARAMAKSIIERMVLERQQELRNGPPRGGAGGASGGRSAPGGGSVSVIIPHDHVGLIIGRGGQTIKGIQSRCGCNVQIPQEADPGSNPPVRTAHITGTPEGVLAAKAEIEQLIAASGGGGGGGGGGGSAGPGITMQIPDNKVGSVIGRGGTMINGIQQRSGCRVQIPRECEPGTMPPMRTISLQGPPEACAIAQREIHAIVTAMPYGQQGGQQQQQYRPPQQQYQQQQQYRPPQQQYQQQQQQYGAPQQQYAQQGAYGQQQQGAYAQAAYSQAAYAPAAVAPPPPPPLGAPAGAAAPAPAAAAAAAPAGERQHTAAEVEAHRKAWEDYYKSQGYQVPGGGK